MISLVLEFVSAINAVDGRYMSTTEKNDLKSSMMRTFNTMSTTIWQADLMNNVTYAGISIDQWILFCDRFVFSTVYRTDTARYHSHESFI